MKKNLLMTSIMMIVWGVVLAFSGEKPLHQVTSASEISCILQAYQNPYKAPNLAGKILSFVNSQINYSSTGQLMMPTMAEVLHKEWDGNDWVNAEKEQIHFNANGWAIESFTFVWDGNAWVNMFWSIITNDATGTPVHILTKMWNAGVWTDMA
jgi:hypothetical protein